MTSAPPVIFWLCHCACFFRKVGHSPAPLLTTVSMRPEYTDSTMLRSLLHKSNMNSLFTISFVQMSNMPPLTKCQQCTRFSLITDLDSSTGNHTKICAVTRVCCSLCFFFPHLYSYASKHLPYFSFKN
jgi:hypothetical protein